MGEDSRLPGSLADGSPVSRPAVFRTLPASRQSGEQKEYTEEEGGGASGSFPPGRRNRRNRRGRAGTEGDVDSRRISGMTVRMAASVLIF